VFMAFVELLEFVDAFFFAYKSMVFVLSLYDIEWV
jgi:hypothetical protein